MDPMDTDTDVERQTQSPISRAATTPGSHPTQQTNTNSTRSAASPTWAPGESLPALARAPPSTSGSTPATASTGPGTGPGTGNEGATGPSLKSRRRGAGIVTPNACSECRKKRAKCDGKNPCTRCKTLKVEACVYEARVRQSKDHLRDEIELLNRQKRSRDQVLAALARRDRPDVTEEILGRLRSGQDVDSLAERLAHGLASRSATAWQPGSSAGLPISESGSAQTIRDVPSSPWDHQYSSTQGSASLSQPSLASTAGPEHARLWDAHVASQNMATPSTMQLDMGATAHRTDTWAHGHGDEDRRGSEEQSFRGMQRVLNPEVPETKVPAAAWTTVTDDGHLVQHLLALYFCWEYPTFASLSKEHFLKDFQDGRTRYCSSMLVNGLLALGCRFSSQPATRASPDNPATSGDHFFKECVTQLREEEDHHKLTTIQALGIMSIREASCGRDSESLYYAGQSIRIALEMGLQLTNGSGEEEDETAVRSATFWGAYSLELAWCLATGNLPLCSRKMHTPPKPAIVDDIESSLWIPYTDNGTPLAQSCEQPSNVRSVYKCFCELSELVHHSLYLLHSPNQLVTGKKLQNTYTNFLDWYGQVPDVLRLGTNFTPSVLFAHMYYHFAILLLFRPFIKLRIKDSVTQPREVCLQAAHAIQGLARSYSKLYTLRRTPSFVPYFILTSTIMHLTIGAEPPHQGVPSGSDPVGRLDADMGQAISRGIADLAEMAPCHHFAEQALNILLHLAKKWKIEIRMTERYDSGGDDGPGPDLQELLDQHRRHPSRIDVRASTTSWNLWVPEFAPQDITCPWGLAPQQSPSPAPQPPTPTYRELRRPWEEHARVPTPTPPVSSDPENPLFWPFPLQGRPLIPSGDRLREYGFEFA